MQRAVMLAALVAVAFLVFAAPGQGQGWPDRSTKDSGFEWVLGTYAPLSGLGKFGSYDLSMDPWLLAGISLRSGEEDARFRTRFEITAVPEVAMRRNPSPEAADCEGECSPDSFRLTLINSRFLMDLTFPFLGETRGYLTAGPAMRIQLSDPDHCPTESGNECALPQFARSRVDPGMVAGLGWEPGRWKIQAVQLTGRMSLYGRGERQLASPATWLPELDLVIRITP